MNAHRRDRFAALDDEAKSAGSHGTPLDAPILPCRFHWLTIELYDDDGKPVANQAYVVRRASGAPVQPGVPQLGGVLDAQGCARILRIDGADGCVIEFPGLNESEVSSMEEDFWQTVPLPSDP